MRKPIDNAHMLALTEKGIAENAAMLIADLAILKAGHAEQERQLRARYGFRLAEMHKARAFYSRQLTKAS